MQVREGFIDGIFNYCDRWCERCAFTSWCRVFAQGAECEAALDPALQALVQAPPLPEDAPAPPPRWMVEQIAEMNEVTREELAERTGADPLEQIAPTHRPMLARAHAYAGGVNAWLRSREGLSRADAADPRAEIAWFHTMIPVKVFRALSSLAFEEDAPGPRDSDGSAKVSLLSIDRSHAAWLDLAERGLVEAAVVQRFIADLVWLGEELEAVFPNARAFVRPAFDEPEEVARLRAGEGV